MKTLWGVWDECREDWAAGTCGTSEAIARKKAYRWGVDLFSPRPCGQFIQAPPQEVVEAVKAIGGGPVVVMQPHQESVHRIRNWIAQAVTAQESET